MNILIVNTFDRDGGAARAGYRLLNALISEDINTQMLVQNKSSGDYRVIGPKSKKEKIINKLRISIDNLPTKLYKNRSHVSFSIAWLPLSNIVNHINQLNPDIVHFHWICGGMIRIEDFIKIKVPIVWSLHDMWAFTGGCHYDEECGAYKETCGNCKILGSIKENDLSRKVWNRKQKTFSKIENMTIVGLSSWLNNCSKNSALLKDKKHINLPNPIDTNIFKSFGKEKSRELWRLPKDKKLILFGAIDATRDPRKGFDELNKAINQLKDKNIELVIFGSSEPKKSQNFRFKTHYLGSLADDVSLVTLYSAVDVMIVPSRQENLSNAIMESLACSTPVVGFDIGGNSDMIEHKKNGYLAKPFDILDLSNGIEWVLNTPIYNELCQNAREKVMKEFDSIIVAKKYIKLYEEILND